MKLILPGVGLGIDDVFFQEVELVEPKVFLGFSEGIKKDEEVVNA